MTFTPSQIKRILWRRFIKEDSVKKIAKRYKRSNHTMAQLINKATLTKAFNPIQRELQRLRVGESVRDTCQVIPVGVEPHPIGKKEPYYETENEILAICEHFGCKINGFVMLDNEAFNKKG